MSKQETLETKPSHYHDAPFDSALVQETIFKNILNSGTELEKSAIKAHWVSFAVKHLLRAGKKDDVDCELMKAENYLHKARTQEWIDD